MRRQAIIDALDDRGFTKLADKLDSGELTVAEVEERLRSIGEDEFADELRAPAPTPRKGKEGGDGKAGKAAESGTEGEGETPPEGEGEGETPPEGEGETPPEGEGEEPKPEGETPAETHWLTRPRGRRAS